MSILKQLKEGVISNNPALVQLIGMCPMLGVSTSLANGLGIGVAVIAVLICSNLVISLLRNFIPSKVRIAAYIVVIAGFVSCIEMLLEAYLPDLSASLGIFIPLIVVNCLILARSEAYASKNKPIPSIVDGLAMGLGFTVAISTLGAMREIIGNGTLTVWGDFGISFIDLLANIGIEYNPVKMIVSPAGAFIMLGVLVACIQGVSNALNKKKEAKSCQ